MSRPLWSAAAVLLCAACSTGGGASLEYVEGQDLPGLAALPDA